MVMASIGLTVALLSIVVSLGSIYINSKRWKNAEQKLGLSTEKKEISLRKQLTMVMEKLIDCQLDLSRLPMVSGSTDKDSVHSEILDDRLRFLLKCAESIVEKIPRHMDPYEYLMLAGMWSLLDEAEKAETRFKRAIGVAEQADREIALRDFASFLFSVGRIEEGRVQYELALEAAVGTTDGRCRRCVRLLLKWANDELIWTNVEEAERLLRRAASESGKISHPMTKRHEDEKLKSVMRAVAAARLPPGGASSAAPPACSA